MQQLNYNFELNSILEIYKSDLKQAKITYLEEFLRYFNHYCPLCQERMVDRSNRMTKVGIIKIEFIPEDNCALAYALCRRCARKTVKTKSKALQKRNGEKIYSHIVEMMTP
jgi:hypothetical protein